MTANFVTFYLILVLITGPFFQYLPVATYLKWDEVLLAKILNQAPTVFLLGYLAFPLNKPKRKSTLLLVLYLITCIIPEIYHYIIHPDNQFITIVINNIVSYVILGWILLGKKNAFDKIAKPIWVCAIGFSSLVFLAFGIAGFEIYQYYIPARPITFLILITFMIAATTIIFLSFLVIRPFRRSWYEIISGVICMVLVDIYIYICFFVINSQPELLYTYGKILFSVGLLLVVDGVSRQKADKKIVVY